MDSSNQEHLILDVLYRYGRDIKILSEVKDILNQVTDENLYLYIGRHSPNYASGYFMVFNMKEGTSWKNKPYWQLTNSDDKSQVFKILESRRFKDKYSTIMIGPNVWGYHTGYRLLYMRKYGYEDVFKELYSDLYEQDCEALDRWAADGYTPRIN